VSLAGVPVTGASDPVSHLREDGSVFPPVTPDPPPPPGYASPLDEHPLLADLRDEAAAGRQRRAG
jgi:hypothetical protein